MTLNRSTRRQPGLLAVLACAALCNCNSTTQSTGTTGGLAGDTTGGGTTGGSAAAVQQPSSVAGKVSSVVVNTSQKLVNVRRLAGDTCAGTGVTVYEVGGTGASVGTGSVNDDGSFSITWTTTLAEAGDTPSEAVLVFNCATAATAALKCYGKPGDSSLVCDPVSNALVAALETSLQAKVEDNPLYKGLSLAKIAAGLVETLKLVSRLNPTNDYASQLAAATTAAQIGTIINASPVGSLFQSIQTLAAQAVAQNQSMAADANSQRMALAAVWTVDKVVSLLAGTGLTIRMGLEGIDDSELYGNFADLIDTSTSTSFMTDMQRFAYTLYQEIYVNKTNTQLVLLCSAQNYSGNGYNATVVYPPDPNRTLAANGNTFLSLTCLGPTALRLGVAVYSDPNCPTAQDPNTCPVESSNQTNLDAYIGSAFQETDRNDPDGTHSYNNGSSLSNNLEVGLVDVFPEFERALVPGGVCATAYAHAADPNNYINGDPDWAPLGPCIRDNGLSKYFAGVLGTYRFLTDPSVHDVRVSLDDIYTAMVDTMNLRLVANFSDYSSNSIQVVVTDAVDSQGNPLDDSQQISIPTILFDAQPADANNTVFQSYCPAAICDGDDPKSEVTMAEVQSVINASRPAFHVLYGLMLHLPDFDTIKQWIFASAHYVNYNTSGTQFYSTSGKDDNNDYYADRPILCKIFEPADSTLAPLAQYHAGNQVSCEVALGTWSKGAEQPVTGGQGVFKDYTRWFGLSLREQSGADFYYALTDLYTGYEVTSDGQAFRIRDTSYHTGLVQDDSGTTILADGITRYQTDVDSCNTYTDSSGNPQSQCYDSFFNYVALRFPNQNATSQPADPNVSFYPLTYYRPFSRSVLLNVSDPRSNGSYQQYLDLAVAAPYYSANDQDMSSSYNVCIARAGISTPRGKTGTASEVDLAGNVMDCSQASSPYYYLVLWNDPNDNVPDASTYVYQVVRNDGLLMQALGCTSGNYCPVTVPMTAVEAALTDLNGGVDVPLGPVVANAYIPYYNILNPRYSTKYDPMCLDRDGNGFCDCYRDPNGTGNFSLHLTATSVPSDADCNLSDNAGDEPTIAQPPTYDETSFVALAPVINPNTGCGNLGGQVLMGCLIDHNFDLSAFSANWNLIFTCVDPNQQLSYVNTDLLKPPVQGNPTPPSDPNMIGGNCGLNGQNGAVFLNAVAKRKNAYDIAKPQTVLKLISSATQDAGTGVQIDRSDNLFNLTEANAMAFFRVAVPLTGLDLQQVTSAGSITDYPNLIPQLQSVYTPWTNSDDNLPQAVLRAFLQKDGSLK